MNPTNVSIGIMFFVGAGCFAIAVLIGLAAIVRILTSGGARTGLGISLIATIISVLGCGAAALSFALLLPGRTISSRNIDFPASHFARATLTIDVPRSLWNEEAASRREALLRDTMEGVAAELQVVASDIASDWGTWQVINIQLSSAKYKSGSVEFSIHLSRNEAAKIEEALKKLRDRARTLINTSLENYLLDPSLTSIGTIITRY
ncbi:MAG: hypothetical protein ACKVS6_08675 [Planctomycetota bacterium]